MRRLPPRSTLFPYTTLCRSCCALLALPACRGDDRPLVEVGRVDEGEVTATVSAPARVDAAARQDVSAAVSGVRSEEHTSELQSRQYFVCRLLFEHKSFAYSV